MTETEPLAVPGMNYTIIPLLQAGLWVGIVLNAEWSQGPFEDDLNGKNNSPGSLPAHCVRRKG